MKHILSKENTLCAQGMSALAIMIMHFVMQIDGYPRFLNILGGEGVAVFLFVSGFGLNESYKKTGLDGYIKKRFLRVIIPCWIVFAFRLPYLDTFSIESFLKNLTFIDSELWFVDYIIQLYIVYWLARKLFSKYTTHILFSLVQSAYSANNLFANRLSRSSQAILHRNITTKYAP